MSYTIVRILQNSVICLLYAGSLRKPNCKLVADINIDCTKTGTKANGEVNISHENTTVVVWIYYVI